MSFNLSGSPTTDDIQVGYIDPKLGYVNGVTICEANDYAKNNPGTVFIFTDGNNNIQYLNINEVNQLTPDDLSSTTTDECGGIQNYVECGPPTIQFYGGGGIGAVGNPVVGADGALLAVDVVSGGFGYQYSPLVSANDPCQNGNGAVLTAVLGETADQIEVYEGEEDFEDYVICEPTDVGYGKVYGLNGEELDEWDPRVYTDITQDPIKDEIEAFQKALEYPFWTTRTAQPDRVTALDIAYATQDTTEVTYSEWGDFMNTYAVSPVKPSDTTGTDEAGKTFIMEWEYNFPVSGEYIFRGVCDNTAQVYIDDSLVGDLLSFKENPIPIQKTIEEGNHVIRVDLLNNPEEETVTTTTTSNITAKFIQEGSSFYLQVDGTGSGEISLAMKIDDSSFIAGVAAKEVRIPCDGDKLKFIREEEEQTIKKTGTFTGGNKYGPIEIIGADPGARGPIIDNPNRLGIRDADGDDENIKITIDKITGSDSTTTQVETIISPKSWNENPMGVSLLIEAPIPPVPQEPLPPAVGECPPNPIWTTRFPGSDQIWYPVNYNGVSATTITTTIEEETETVPNIQSETQEVEFTITAEGGKDVEDLYFVFTSSDGQHNFTLDNVSDKEKKTEKIQIRKNVLYTVVGKSKQSGDLEQGTLNNSTSIFLDYTDSANDNDDMLVSASAGLFTQGDKREVGGRSTRDITYIFEPAPNNVPTTEPTTIVTNFDEVPAWSEFFNRYAISPVLPLNTPGTDGSGVVHKNSWPIEIPYRGFYAFQVQRDNTARIYVDGNLAFDVLTSGDAKWIESGLENKVKTQKIFLEAGLHTISIELENTPEEVISIIEQKVFSTQDWRSTLELPEQVASNLTAKFIQEGSSYYLQVDGTGSGEISFVMDVNDSNYIAGVAAKEVRIPSDNGNVKFVREGTTGAFGEGGLFEGSTLGIPTEEKIKESGTFTGGNKYGPIEIIGADPGARGPIIDNPNRLGIRDADGDDENIKITIDKITGSTTSAGASPETFQSVTKNGVTYEGPTLFGYIDSNWSTFMNDYSVSPEVFDSIDLPDQRVVGKYTLTWKNVNFPQDGDYKFNFQADNIATLTIGGRNIYTTTDFIGERVQYIFNATAGNYDVVIELENTASNSENDTIFSKNPMGVSLYISADVTFAESNKKSWIQNPIGISAILIPPPCAKRIGGKGVVDNVIVEDPGNGYLPVETPGTGYPVTLVLDRVIVDNPGINYSCGEDEIQIVPSNGAELSYSCSSFGQITEVKVLNPGYGFNTYPRITIPSETGVNASFIPVFRVVRDPIPAPDTIIQVTDLVGLKQTGYVDGRAYYGAIYYDKGIPYAGYYKTAGTQVRVYATLQESITAQVTTPPSAIQRSGTDIRSNDPRLNIPGTIQDTQT
jgi:hypothetical protein